MSMTPLVSEWVEKAEGDWRTVLREYRARLDPNYDAVCFHAQQCAEKYIKGILQNLGIAFPKTHSLGAILDLLPLPRADWETLQLELRALSNSAVEIRYPGFTVGKAEAKIALTTCRKARDLARQQLGLPPAK